MEDAPAFTELGQFRIHGPSVRLLGYGFSLHNHVVVLGDATADPDTPVTVGMVHPEDRALVAATVLCAVSQRLARTVCESCREEVTATAEERRRLGVGADERFARGSGCATCAGSGLKGRTGVFELFVPDAEIVDMITAEEPVHVVRQAALDKGMRSLLADAMDKARAGAIPLAEVLRIVPYRML